jgi:putative hemolysin
MELLVHLSFLLLLLFLSGFFSGSETALFSIPESRRESFRRGKGARAVDLLSRPQRLLITILFGNMLVNIAATSSATALCLDLFGARGLGVAILAMTFLILVLGEIVPKAVAYRRNEAVAPLVAAPVETLMRLLTPLVAPLRLLTNAVLRAGGVEFSRSPYRPGELETAVHFGPFGPVEKELLLRLVHFGGTTVREIMTPRVQVEAIPADMSGRELEALFRKKGFSRMPVHGERFEEIRGVLYAKDLFARPDDLARETAGALCRKPFFVPESMKIRNLMRRMKEKRVHYAVVVDEHGSLEGIVTLEDVLEEIVGELEDERREEMPAYTRLRQSSVTAMGHLELEKLNELLGTRLESEDAETVAGYLLEHIGRIPRTGESFRFGGLKFLVLDALPNRIERLHVEKLPLQEETQ